MAEARAHVEQCEECREYLAQDDALLGLYDQVRRRTAPLATRERVFDALARERFEAVRERRTSSRAKRGRVFVGIALGVGALVLVASLAGRGRNGAVPAADPGIFAEDYLRRAVGEDQIVSSDPVEVARFLRRELGRELDLLDLSGLALERAEVCLISGRRGAIVVYRRDGATISHYLVPREDAPRRAPALAEYRAGPGGGRMPVVVWSAEEVEQALIGEVSAAELLRIADGGAT